MLKNGYSRVLFRNADSDMVFSDARRGTLGLEKLALVFICGFQEIGLRLLPTVSGTCCGRSCTARRPRRRVGPLCHAGAGHLQAKQTTNRPAIHPLVVLYHDPLHLYLSIAVNALAPFSFPVATLEPDFWLLLFTDGLSLDRRACVDGVCSLER